MVDHLKKILQSNRYAKIWATLALFSFVGGALMLAFVRGFKWRPKIHFTPRNVKQALGNYTVPFIAMSVFFLVFHIAILLATPGIRRWRSLRRTPIPPVMAFGCILMMFIPIACTIDGSLSDTSLDWFSFGAAILFTIDIFCMHMAMFPSYDYMGVHISLGILATIILSISRTSDRRVDWIIVTSLCMFFILTVHHWVTGAAAVIEGGNPRHVDARVPPVEILLVEEVDQVDETITYHGCKIVMFFVFCILGLAAFVTLLLTSASEKKSM